MALDLILWRAWYHRADPIVTGALRLTLEGPLDQNDPSALGLYSQTLVMGQVRMGLRVSLTALMARFDERAIEYGYSNDRRFAGP